MKRSVCLISIGCLMAFATVDIVGVYRSAQAKEESLEVLRSWEDDYAALKAAITSRNNPYALLKEVADRKDVANIHSLIWDRDRTPADVALRRTEALLAPKQA